MKYDIPRAKAFPLKEEPSTLVASAKRAGGESSLGKLEKAAYGAKALAYDAGNLKSRALESGRRTQTWRLVRE